MKNTDTQDTFFPDPEPVKNLSVIKPLAERCRPKSLAEFLGQEKILGSNGPLRKAIEKDQVPSMILWGPPGTGKTTLAYLIAHLTKALFLKLSATDSGIKDLRKIIDQAQNHQGKTILFIDEIHRWNKSQQDALLPHVETGLITLIGATTENPSFEVNGALLSRTTVFTLESLTPEHIIQILKNGVQILTHEGLNIIAEANALELIAANTHGDARVALNQLQQITNYITPEDDHITINQTNVQLALQEKKLLYDKSGEEHYNLISAFHKSMRGSDPQGTLYWLARMLEAGEDPLYIARRMIRFAAEDVGLAAPNALAITIAARDAYHMLGTPEGELALAEAAVYLATSPKSNAVYVAYNQARQMVKQHGYLPVPHHIRNAPTKLMKDLGYGANYQYAHDFEEAFSDQEYLPDKLAGLKLYQPTNRGHEKIIDERMKHWQHLAKQQKENKKS